MNKAKSSNQLNNACVPLNKTCNFLTMNKTLKIILWNANGLAKHQTELEVLLNNDEIDVCLIAETHFTRHSYLNFKHYSLYHTIHPNNCARGGSAVLIKNNITHHLEDQLSAEEFQTTSVSVEAFEQQILVTALYSPPRHQLKSEDYVSLIERYKGRFIIGGDFNAKHIHWGSRLTTTKGREMFKAIRHKGCEIISTGKPTYWPSDTKKVPDLIDFFVFKNIPANHLSISEGFDLNSDHSPILLEISGNAVLNKTSPRLFNNFTDWQYFQLQLEAVVVDTDRILTIDDLDDAVLQFTQIIQNAAWNSTPQQDVTSKKKKYPSYIKMLINKKRKLRRRWQQTRYPEDKLKLNQTTKQLHVQIQTFKNDNFNRFLKNLTSDKSTDYSLWKAAKSFNRPIKHIAPIKINDTQWAKTNKQKANLFAENLRKTFSANDGSEDIDIASNWIESDVSIKPVSSEEVMSEIFKMKTKKTPGFDLITAEILQRLPNNCATCLSQLINLCFLLKYVPMYWKTAEVIMILKAGKSPNDVSSYRPISLLPMMSKLFERLLLARMLPIIENKRVIPSHQFGFRKNHSTIDQVHRVVRTIECAMEENKVCAAVFLDVSQAFDKVWHTGLLHKLKLILPRNYCEILSSYLDGRYFRVRLDNAYSSLEKARAGVPQGSILGPLLYLLYTHDLPVHEQHVTATFADDTAILAVGEFIETTTTKLQSAVNSIATWAKKWRIKLNNSKSVHIVFGLKKTIYKPVYINSVNIPYVNEAKYLGITLDAKLRWKAHVKKKREELELKTKNLLYLIGRHSILSTNNKILLYNQILKPVWTYGIQLWGCSSESCMTIIQRFQNKVLRNIVNAPYYVRNLDLHRDLGMLLVTDVAKKYAMAHRQRLTTHVNAEALALLQPNTHRRRLKRKTVLDQMGTQ